MASISIRDGGRVYKGYATYATAKQASLVLSNAVLVIVQAAIGHDAAWSGTGAFRSCSASC